MSDQDLNKENFHLVALGSGLTEVALTTACALAGKKCLILDKNSRYGTTLGNYNLKHYLELGNTLKNFKFIKEY